MAGGRDGDDHLVHFRSMDVNHTRSLAAVESQVDLLPFLELTTGHCPKSGSYQFVVSQFFDNPHG